MVTAAAACVSQRHFCRFWAPQRELAGPTRPVGAVSNWLFPACRAHLPSRRHEPDVPADAGNGAASCCARQRVPERVTPFANRWIGVIGISVGILSMTMGSKRDHRKGIYLALLNAFVIASYTLVDGVGVRRSGSPAAYTLWVFLLTGLPFAIWAVTGRRTTFVPYVSRHWRIGMVGGVGTTASYGLALWAMTIAPVAVIAALRETSILFGTLIAGLVLKEHIGMRRIIAACIIASSAAVLRLA